MADIEWQASNRMLRNNRNIQLKIILIGFSLLILCFSSVLAQTDNTVSFVPDRPGFATPPDVLEFRIIQLEDGLQYTNFFVEGIHNQNFLFSSLLVRYGLLRFAELRVQTDFAYNITTDSSGKYFTTGMNPITIGTKVELLSQQNVIPNISLLCNLTLPFIGKREFLPKTFTLSIYLLMSNDLTQKLNLCYNYGLVCVDGIADLLHFYAVCLNFQPSSKWGFFVEGYGVSGFHTSPSFNIDMGLAYLINDHLQVDFSASGSITEIRDFYLLNMGVAWKIPGRNKINKNLPTSNLKEKVR